MGFVRMSGALVIVLVAGVVMAADGKAEGPTRSGLEQEAKPPKIKSMKPDGWLQSLTEPRSNGAYSYALTNKAADVTVIVRAEPARDRSANRRAAELAWEYGAAGLVVLEVEKAEDGRTLASAVAVGSDRHSGQVQVIRFGARSPKTRPDLLVVVIASWHGDLTPQLREEIDLILLSATAE